MVSPRDTFCPMTGIPHATLQTRGCPHCLLDLQPELGKLPSTLDTSHTTPIKQEPMEPSITLVKKEIEAIDLTGSPKKSTTFKAPGPRFNSYISNRAIVESTRKSTFKTSGKVALKAATSNSIKSTTSLIPKPGAETRPVIVILGPFMGSQRDYFSIGVSTYTFQNREESISDWSIYMRDYILPNHVGWNDYEFHDRSGSTIKRYSLATHWSKTRGPTYLGRKESEANTVGEFLSYFPSAQSTIYIIVEFLSEDLPHSPKGKTKREVESIRVKKENRQSMPDIRELRKRTRDSLTTPSPTPSDDPFQLSPESHSPLHKRIRAFTSRLRHSVGSSIYSSKSPEGTKGSTQSLPLKLEDQPENEERISIASLLE